MKPIPDYIFKTITFPSGKVVYRPVFTEPGYGLLAEVIGTELRPFRNVIIEYFRQVLEGEEDELIFSGNIVDMRITMEETFLECNDDETNAGEPLSVSTIELYELLTSTPTQRIYDVVKQIPKGKVASYGQIARLAGDKNMARAVGNALHKNPDPDSIPCFRVVNAKGELAGAFAFGGENAQAKLLIADGVEVVDGKVDMKKYQWDK